MTEKEKKPLVYIPPGAKINVENINDQTPTTKYEKRRVIFHREKVNRIVGGRYGKKDD